MLSQLNTTKTNKNNDIYNNYIMYIKKFPIKVYTPIYIVEAKKQCPSCKKTNTVISLGTFKIEYDGYSKSNNFYILHSIYDLPNEIRHKLYEKYSNWNLNIKSEYFVSSCKKCKTIYDEFIMFNEPGEVFNPLKESDIDNYVFKKIELSEPSYDIKASYSTTPYISPVITDILKETPSISFKRILKKKINNRLLPLLDKILNGIFPFKEGYILWNLEYENDCTFIVIPELKLLDETIENKYINSKFYGEKDFFNKIRNILYLKYIDNDKILKILSTYIGKNKKNFLENIFLENVYINIYFYSTKTNKINQNYINYIFL